jgi:phosphoribosylamine---glycine ligase
MKVLVLGGGGREHAIVSMFAQSIHVDGIYCVPGNGGIAQQAIIADVDANDPIAIAEWAAAHAIDLTVVGPENLLAAGIVDIFQERKLAIFGPNRQAAQLEASKIFTKECCTRWKIPTASYAVFDQPEAAKAYIQEQGVPIVIKPDGLCAGKGTIVASNMNEALGAVTLIMEDRVFGEAGRRILVEEALIGEEVSVLALCDGKTFTVLPSAQDHKRLLDGAQGPNTGGMGAYSPAPLMTDDLRETITRQMIEPTLTGLQREGIVFTGILYAGIMLTEQGPMLLEYNVRFGDPEAQAVLPRLKTDIMDVMQACIQGTLSPCALEWDRRSSVCVVAASAGYPGESEPGKIITGLEDATALPDTIVYHAGTKISGKTIMTAGGRVLNVTALDASIDQAVRKAYQAMEKIHFEGMQYRRDIAWRVVQALPEVAS